MFLGEWGAALREIEDANAMFDKNANYHWAQGMRLNQAWVSLHAMDFSGVLAICQSTLALTRETARRSVTEPPRPHPVVVLASLFLTGAAETALGNHEKALEDLLAARKIIDRSTLIFVWLWKLPLESAITELWLAKSDVIQARRQADRVLAIACGTTEHTWQALAWEASARVAIAERDLVSAEECVTKGLSAMEGFEVPLAAWRVHATAAELYQRMGSRQAAERHLVLSRETVTKLANALPADESLRRTFLSAPVVRRILDDGDAPTARAKGGAARSSRLRS